MREAPPETTEAPGWSSASAAVDQPKRFDSTSTDTDMVPRWWGWNAMVGMERSRKAQRDACEIRTEWW